MVEEVDSSRTRTHCCNGINVEEMSKADMCGIRLDGRSEQEILTPYKASLSRLGLRRRVTGLKWLPMAITTK